MNIKLSCKASYVLVLFAAAVLVAAAFVLLAELELLPVAFFTVACTI